MLDTRALAVEPGGALTGNYSGKEYISDPSVLYASFLELHSLTTSNFLSEEETEKQRAPKSELRTNPAQPLTALQIRSTTPFAPTSQEYHWEVRETNTDRTPRTGQRWSQSPKAKFSSQCGLWAEFPE